MKNQAINFSLVVLAALLLISCLGGGSGTTSTVPSSVGETEQTPMLADVLRVGDSFEVRLTGVPVEEEKLINMMVDGDGYISMPLVGRFKAQGLTTAQLKLQIEEAYRTKKIYATPNISILVNKERYVNVSGEVRIPQRVLFTNDMTILKAITACGGFTDYANRRDVKLLRGSQVIVFNAVEAFKNPSQDLPLQVGDQIQVPRTMF